MLAFDTKDPDGTWHKNTKTRTYSASDVSDAGGSNYTYTKYYKVPKPIDYAYRNLPNSVGIVANRYGVFCAFYNNAGASGWDDAKKRQEYGNNWSQYIMNVFRGIESEKSPVDWISFFSGEKNYLRYTI